MRYYTGISIVLHITIVMGVSGLIFSDHTKMNRTDEQINREKRRILTIPLLPTKDGIYYTTISIGTPPQQFKLTLDTGAALPWVPDCNTNWGTGNSFDASASRKSVITESGFVQPYQNGSVIGWQAIDKITIGEVSLKKTTFGLAVKRGKLFFLPEGIDGSFGVPLRASPVSDQWDFVSRLIIDRHVTHPYLSLSFSCTAAGEGLEPGGTLVIGRFQLRGRWTNEVVSLSTEKWELPLVKVSIGRESVQTENHFIEPDLTQPFLIGPQESITKINRILKATRLGESGTFLLDCKQQYPYVKIKFNEEVTLAVQPEQFILKRQHEGSQRCFSPFSFQNGFRLTQWRLGTSILRNYLTVFYGAGLSVGFTRRTCPTP